MNWTLVLALMVGVVAGVFGGVFGLAGGVVLIPLLLWFFPMTQHQAQGTSLFALLFPTGLLAFWQYYKVGNTSVGTGIMVAVGMFIGGYFGGMWAQHMHELLMRRMFAVLLVVVAARLFLK
jgi:uncharacterized membrane protein YfcA